MVGSSSSSSSAGGGESLIKFMYCVVLYFVSDVQVNGVCTYDMVSAQGLIVILVFFFLGGLCPATFCTK